MQAVKVSWVGQTFALAKCNDSRGKKSRTRRTKEERKKMVESFINKYRSSNKGNFPSLNLTHKEVGGSFYTVREIVREIIQENKVLGPANVSLEEQCTSSSISEGPHGHLSLSSAIGNAINHTQPEIIFLSKEDQNKHEEPDATSGQGSSNWCYEMVESRDNETVKSKKDACIPQYMHRESAAHQQQTFYSDGNFVSEQCKEDEATKPSKTEPTKKKEDGIGFKEVVSSEKLDIVEDVVASSADKVAPFYNADDFLPRNVEDFEILKTDHPYDSTHTSSAGKCAEISILSDSMDVPTTSVAVDAAASKAVFSNNTPETKIIPDAETGNTSVEQLSPGCLREPSPLASTANSTISQNGMSESAETTRANPMSENSGFHEINSPYKDADLEVTQNDSLMLQSFDQSNLLSKVEPLLAPTDAEPENVTANADKTHEESTATTEGAETNAEVNLKFNSSLRNGTSVGISSQSLGKDTRKSTKVEDNPVWALVKAFMAAVAKFWGE